MINIMVGSMNKGTHYYLVFASVSCGVCRQLTPTWFSRFVWLLAFVSLIGKLLIGYVDTSRRTSGNASSSYLPSSVSSMAVPRPKAAVVSQTKRTALGTNKSNDNQEESDEEEDLWDT